MKTKEQVLQELFYKPETRDWYKPVIEAMQTYADQFIAKTDNNSLPCVHNFIQKDTFWKSCTHCGMLMPLGQ